MRRSTHILNDFKLRQTDCRNEILDVFLDKDFALSHTDIEICMKEKFTIKNENYQQAPEDRSNTIRFSEENKIPDTFDRVTVYRTLKTFVEKGIIHKVLDDSGAIKYALCKENCAKDGHHHHEHVHFKCIDCGLTHCIEDVEVPQVRLPKGYKFVEANLLIQGVCLQCSQ